MVEALATVLPDSPTQDGLARSQAINDNQYVAGMNRMAQGVEDGEDALYLELTNPQVSDD
ncbi:hypothetical protein [Pseudomonas xanthosomatis]|uniref:hypothetical protein n=1 Tax=Pseudomonas xanthosomatis TaxID=2842356 RepID=UPI0035189A62